MDTSLPAGFLWLACEPGPSISIGDAVTPGSRDLRMDDDNLVAYVADSWIRCEKVNQKMQASFKLQRTSFLKAAIVPGSIGARHRCTQFVLT